MTDSQCIVLQSFDRAIKNTMNVFKMVGLSHRSLIWSFVVVFKFLEKVQDKRLKTVNRILGLNSLQGKPASGTRQALVQTDVFFSPQFVEHDMALMQQLQ